MEGEYGKNERRVEYEVPRRDREMVARKLREQLRKKLDGYDTVYRFVPRGGRVTMCLPYGEDLLAHTEFAMEGKFGDATILRAYVDIPFEGEANAPYSNDPYRETVELTYYPSIRAPDVPVRKGDERAEDPEVPDRDGRPPETPAASTRATVRYRVAAVLAIGAALVAGTVAADMAGVIDITGAKRRPAPAVPRQEPAYPPVFIPGNPWGLPQR